MQLVVDPQSVRNVLVSWFLIVTTLFSFTAQPVEKPLLYGEELGCLAMNIYQEARGESTQGKMAVGAVTLNRVKSKRYPNTICEVVWQPKQFSWTSLKIKYHSPKNFQAWEQALQLAKLFMDGAIWPGVGSATHYHAITVTPSWMDKEQLVARYGNHLFYTL